MPTILDNHRRPLPSTPGRAQGFTLVELVVVIAIIAIVAAIGWGSLYKHLPRFRLVNAAKALKSDLVHLRNLSISSNRETRLRFVSGGGDCSDLQSWGGSWALEIGDRSSSSTRWEMLPEDSLQDGSDDDRSQGLTDLGPGGNEQSKWICLDEWGTIIGPGSGNADALVFSPRGWLSNPDADFLGGSGWVTIPLRNQVAARDGLEDRIDVRINRVGAIRLQSSLESSP